MIETAERAPERRAMVRGIEAELRALGPEHLPALPPKLIEALLTVPRHLFVPEEARAMAYEDRPLGIGAGQTISQPFIVALMTALLDPRPGQRVLEIGTGSGYQAAILAYLGAEVYSVETVPALARTAVENLRAAGCEGVHLRTGDGNEGWREHAPFDGIVVTAAAEQVPSALEAQLRPGGRMVIPSGPHYGPQELMLITKDERLGYQSERVLAVAFVPLVHPSPSGGGGTGG